MPRVGDIEVDSPSPGSRMSICRDEPGGGTCATVRRAGIRNSFGSINSHDTSILQQSSRRRSAGGIGVADGTRTRDVLDHNQASLPTELLATIAFPPLKATGRAASTTQTSLKTRDTFTAVASPMAREEIASRNAQGTRRRAEVEVAWRPRRPP